MRDTDPPLVGKAGAARMARVLASAVDSIRLFLHVGAATIWVGGQLVLAALVPVLRARDPALPKVAARAFNRVAWPAFGVLIATGIWNIMTVGSHTTSAYKAVLAAKILVVAASGITAYLHTRANTTAGLAVFGALTGLTALGALYLGILLAG